MTKLPVLSGQDCIKVLAKAGFAVHHQKGSHIVLRRENPRAMVVVPNHRELDRGTLRAIVRQAGLSLEDFLKLMT